MHALYSKVIRAWTLNDLLSYFFHFFQCENGKKDIATQDIAVKRIVETGGAALETNAMTSPHLVHLIICWRNHECKSQ